MIKTLFPLLALAAICACSAKKPTTKQDAAQLARTVTTARIERRPIAGSVTASGLLVSREEAAVSPEVSGYRVARVLVDEGDLVRAGQALAFLDPKLLEAKLAQAKAAVAEATARADQAAGEAARVAGLDGTGVLSDEQIATRRLQSASARATVASARAQLRDLEVQRTKMVIRAPVAGIVLQRALRPGDIASLGGDPMFQIARDRLVELDAELAENALDGFRPGAPARVTLPAGGSVQGRVRFVSPRVDAQTKLGRVRVALPVDPRLRPGGFARATLDRPRNPIAAVPESAVQFEAAGSVVVTIDANGRARRVPVRTGERAGGWVALVTGPPVGTRVALGGGAFVLDGDRVAIEGDR